LLSRHLATFFFFFFFFFLRLSVFGLFFKSICFQAWLFRSSPFLFFYLIVLFLYFWIKLFLINIITMIFKNYPIMPYFSNKNIFFMVILSIILWRIYTNLICRFKKKYSWIFDESKIYVFFIFLMYYIYIYIYIYILKKYS
jgi:hypothetical protein